MSRTVVVNGHVVSSTILEVDEAIPDGAEEVRVLLRPEVGRPGDPASVAHYLLSLPPGTRTKADIDRQIDDDRGAWDE